MIGNLQAWVSEVAGKARMACTGRNLSVKVTPPQHPNGGYVVDFDGERVIGQLIVWSNGAIEGSAIEVATDTRIYFKDAAAIETKGLDDLLDEFLAAIAGVELGH